MIKIFKYSFYDLTRSLWGYLYLSFYFISSMALLSLSHDLSRAIVSLMNIIIIITPLVSIVLGTMHYYNSKEFAELLLAQPIKRSSVFLGQYFGLASSLCLSLILGLGIPFVIYGVFVSDQIWNFSMLLLVGVFLTLIFTALAYLIACSFENKIKGFGIAIVTWLTLAVVYDGLFLLVMVLFESYPLEKASLVVSMFNPIDLSRILIMLKLDISSLMGYTGALFNKFFGSAWGVSIVLACLLLWVWLPVFTFYRIVSKKDF